MPPPGKLAAAGAGEWYVRVVITRGTGPLTYDPSTATAPLRVIIAAPVSVPPLEHYERGVGVSLLHASRPTDDDRAAGAKASNYLANLLAVYEAKQQGAQEALMLESLRELSQRHEQLHLRICFSKSMDGLMPGVENIEGRVSVALMQDLLPSNNYQFFVCAPSRMMEQMIADLIDWQVPQDDIHLEAFGAATVKSSSSAARIVGEKGSASRSVTFKRSRKQVLWTPEDGTLLDLAEANGVVIDTGCRAGNCGACFTAIQSGEVDYLVPPGAEHEDSVCLPCVSTPGSDLVVDA